MLDKSIEYCPIFMMRPSGIAVPRWQLPPGYRFVTYTAGDEQCWADIETSAGEFPEPQAALEYFKGEFLPYAGELQRRMLFAENASGEKTGTATVWWKQYLSITGEIRQMAALHWVGVKESCWGQGIGKALVAECLRCWRETAGDCEFCLSTQTWSHRAIGIYHRAGFEYALQGTFDGKENSTARGVEILGMLGLDKTQQ